MLKTLPKKLVLAADGGRPVLRANDKDGEIVARFCLSAFEDPNMAWGFAARTLVALTDALGAEQ